MGTVTTSTRSDATAFGNQRREDRCQNGVLWAISTNTASGTTAGQRLTASYSTDGGSTWTVAGDIPTTSYVSGTSNFTDASLFIDLDDFAHVVYKNAGSGYIEYVRGTPNAARTAYNWSAAVTINAAADHDHPDIVAHREGSGWVAHIVENTAGVSSTTKVFYRSVVIAANGTTTLNPASSFVQVSATLGSGNSNPAYASIDFNHTGDGKTVKDGAPHLYVGWSAGATGAGYGIRFRKATYASGSWTWGTEREITQNSFVPDADRWINCMFDGTRILITGMWHNGMNLFDRDAADTVTTPQALGSDFHYSGSATYDSQGNIYYFGRTTTNGTGSLQRTKWTRANNGWNITSLAGSGKAQPFVSARRGPQGQAIDYVYTDGTASPYEVKSGRIVLNQNPTAPTPQTPADNATWDSSADQTVTFRHNDPDGDPTSSYAVWLRPAGTSATYQAITGTATVANGGTATITIPANTVAGVLSYYSTTTDPSGAVSPPSPIRTVTAVPASLAAATGGSGGTAFTALTLYNATEVDRVQRVVTRAVLTTVTAVSPLTITIDGGPVTALRNAGYTPTVGDQVQAEYTSGQWVVVDKVVS